MYFVHSSNLIQLNSDSFSTSVISGGGKNINDFLENGIYSTDETRPSTTNMKNYPVDVTAHILVISSKVIVTQIYITHDVSCIYIRGRYIGNDFSDWKLVC